MIIKYFLPIIAISIVITLHELGHFLSAKFFKIKVEVFSIGIGKKLIQFTRKNTTFAISLIPIGGYCRLKCGDVNNPILEDDSMDQLTPYKRAVIYFAGPFFNFLLAILMLSLTYLTPTNTSIPPTILPVMGQGLPGELYGLQEGDKIIKINGTSINSFNDISKNISYDLLKIEVERKDQIILIELVPLKKGGETIIGIYPYIPLVIQETHSNILNMGDEIIQINKMAVDDFLTFSREIMPLDKFSITIFRNGVKQSYNLTKDEINKVSFISKTSYNIFSAILLGTRETIEMTIKLTTLLIDLFQTGEVKNSISSPLRLVYDIGNTISSIYSISTVLITLTTLFTIIATISLTLGIINLLPIPVLDGGQIIINIITMIKGSPLSSKIIIGYQTVGLVVILLLFTIGISNDIFYFGDL